MNKLEKYIKNNCVYGQVKKDGNNWIVISDNFGEHVLGKTIDTALIKLTELFPENTKDERTSQVRCLDDLRYTPPPVMFFEIGESVLYGGHRNCVISEIFDGGMYYKIERDHSKKYGHRQPGRTYQFTNWMSLEKKDTVNQTPLSYRDKFPIQSFQTHLDEIFSKYFFFGLDLNPDYQRGNVWTYEDREKLLDSIFNNINIGKFCFNRKPYKENDTSYEVIDGKQRITTLIDFRLDKFKYKGLYYSELNPCDKRHIRNYIVEMTEIEEASKEKIYNYFLKLNTGGRAVDPEHIKYVEELLNNIKKD